MRDIKKPLSIICGALRTLTRVSYKAFTRVALIYWNSLCLIARPWFYQTCNEYGWYQSSRSNNQPFGNKFPATFNIELCKDVFSSKFGNEQVESNIAQTNEDFGGLEPNVENVYMTHGELDPWSAMGHGVAEGATVITKASHCTDFDSISSSDSAEMRASKERIAELVREWLA